MSKSLFKSTSVIVSMTTISRIFGFLRDMIMAQLFGAGALFDAFIIAFKIPNFMRRLFAEGSFAQAFVPVLSEYKQKQSPQEINRFINAMSGTLGLILLLVTLLGVVFAPAIVRVFAAGFTPEGERYNLAVTMLRITFPYLMLISLTAFSGAILNTYSRFWVAAFTPVFLNISMIGCAIWLAPHLAVPITGLAYGVFIAGVVQLLFQIPFLKKMGLLPRPLVDFKNPGVIQVLKLMVPALLGVSVSQVNLLLDTVFASFLAVGSVAWLHYSDRLMEFPLGVFGVAISTVILPSLSHQAFGKTHKDFSSTLDWALRTILLVGLPAALFLALLAGPLLSTLFQYRQFDAYAVIMARKSLSMFALGIAPFMIIKILAAGFYAKQNMRIPVRIGIIAMVANMVFNVMLIWPLAHAGIALATSLAAFVNMALLYYFLRKLNYYQPRAGWGHFLIRLVCMNSMLGGWLYFAAGPLQMWLDQDATWRCLHLLALFSTAIALYFVGLWVLGMRLRDFLTPPAQLDLST